MGMPDLTNPRTLVLLAQLRAVLMELDALPPRAGLHNAAEEAEHVIESISPHIAANKKFLWNRQRAYQHDPRYSPVLRTLDHLEAWLLIYEGQQRHLSGLLTLARTAPKEGPDT